MNESSDEQQVASTVKVEPGREYFVITLTADEEGEIVCGTQTIWVGWASGSPRREIRQGYPVAPEKVHSLWLGLGQPYIVVNSEGELAEFYRIGGNALVEGGIARQFFSDALAARTVAYDGLVGFVSVARLPRGVRDRAPSMRVRMRVLKRDGYRCKICGRRPADHEDIELHVHHVRPWAAGGLTQEKNLITLCSTCHKGLEPHGELGLFSLVGENTDGDRTKGRNREFRVGVERYRKAIIALVDAAKAQRGKTRRRNG